MTRLALCFLLLAAGASAEQLWAVGGHLFDKHCKGFGMLRDGTDSGHRAFAYNRPTGFSRLAGSPTILIAGCRAKVALNIGDTVQVPKELCQ